MSDAANQVSPDPRELNRLLKFLQRNTFQAVIVEGPRGSGKTTLVDKLLSATDMVYYKTWGENQKWTWRDMQEKMQLDLPQGTYFVLDCIAQIAPALSRPLLFDRGNLSAISYQRTLPWGRNNDLHKYYVELMLRSKACMLVMDAPVDTLLDRRIRRGEKDEQKLYQLDPANARKIVEQDDSIYGESVETMIQAGLEEAEHFELDDYVLCTALTPKGAHLVKEDHVNESAGD